MNYQPQLVSLPDLSQQPWKSLPPFRENGGKTLGMGAHSLTPLLEPLERGLGPKKKQRDIGSMGLIIKGPPAIIFSMI